uniref:Gypsy retrotransposon integrase-like protein 1 n=1 Tax=Oryzias latipes TaxID=8090 RepID=A0A3B3HH25_ORYLA
MKKIVPRRALLHSNFRADVQVDGVHARQHGGARAKTRAPPHRQKVMTHTQDTVIQCTRCGDSRGHSMQQCPAREAVCNQCRKKGHYARVCRTKQRKDMKIAMVTEDSNDGFAFLGSMSDKNTISPWITEVDVNSHSTVFKIDTGADVTAVSETLYKEGQFGKLEKPTKVLRGPGGSRLQVQGMFTANLHKNNKNTKEDIYVVKGLSMPLLSGTAAIALQLVARVENIILDSTATVKREFPRLFSGLGKMEGEYNIVLKPNAQPFSLSTPRRISLPLMPKVKEELTRMEQQGVISKVDQPTEWCAPMVVVPKRTGRVRICTDLTELNKSVLREKHPLPSVENTLGQLAGAKVFSKLDANAGFWQIPLSKDSSLLTTFITPFGRYCYNRLCFGISSAPEHFQKRMSRILEGLDGVLCQMDDVLIWGTTQEEHDERLRRALSRLQEAGVTLNDKCEFSKSRIKFLGQIIEGSGVSPDPEKVKAITGMQEPTNVSEVRRFLGMANHLGKFLPHLAEKTRPLRDLLRKSNMWNWGSQQQKAFESIRADLTTPPGLALYNPNAETLVSADSSSYGMGAVLLQKQENVGWKPVAYASRALSETEQRYAQIEKEALALTWACERFQEFLIGKCFHMETDHKPLVPLLGSKRLDELPPRIQRLRMRLMRFSFTISHVAGKNIATADVLSRAPVGGNDSDLSEEDINLYVDAVISSLPATESRLQQIKTHQENDVMVQQLKKCCVEGWPDKFSADRSLQPYLQYSGDLSVHSGLLLYGSRIVIPASLKKDILSKLHEGHLGITKCRARAKQSVWWPGLSKELTEMIEKCDVCARERTNLRETLIPTEFPTRPWSTVGADLFQFGSQHYLIVVDYHSRYFEVAKLTSTTSEGVIEHFKSVFARHGIPDEVRTDNGPQFSSEHFRNFVRCWNFKHVTSSPHFPQSNGEAERAVRTVKNLLKKSGDPYLALMAYRSAPLANGYSPAELLMGRRIRTTVPMISSQLNPEGADMKRLRKIEQKYRQKLQQDYNSRHRAHDLSQLQPGDHVWVKGLQERGTVVSAANTPRSYVIDTPKGVLRRNRYHLSPTPVAPETPALSPPQDTRGSVAPEENELEQETSVSERRFPVRARAPPAYLKDYVCSINRN